MSLKSLTTISVVPIMSCRIKILMKLIFTRSLVSFAAKIYPGQNRDGEAVQKHPGDAPDNGYIAIVTIVVATVVVLMLTVVRELFTVSGKF